MLIEKYKIEEFNHEQLPEHKTQFDFLASTLKNTEAVLEKLIDFQVAIPSWALGRWCPRSTSVYAFGPNLFAYKRDWPQSPTVIE